jgi:hypothetical protein
MLNLNYTLLSEGANSRYKIPSYRNYSSPSIYSEGYMISKLTEFNQIMRECQVELSSIIPSSDPTYIIPVSEAGIVSSITTTIKTIISKAIEAIKNIFRIIRNFISQSIKNISEKVEASKYSKIEKMNSSERIKILRQVIYNLPSDQIPQFKICDLTITKDLLSSDFPNTKFIGSKLAKMTTDALDTYVYSYDRASKSADLSSYESDSNSAESLANYLNDNSESVLSGIFGNYSYDPTNITSSAMEASRKAFGSNEFNIDFKLSTDLYLKACDSADTIKDVAKNLEKELKEVEASEKEITACLNKAMNVSNNMGKYLDQVKSYPNGIDLNAKFTEITKKMVYNLNRIMLFVNQAIAAEEIIIRNKSLRANSIYKCALSIKNTCHRLINIQLGTDEESTNEAYDPSDDVRDAEILEEQFESILCMTEEFWLENEYNQTVMQYLTEDDTGASNPTAAPGAASDTAKADSVQTTVNTSDNNNLANTQQGKKFDGASNFIDRFNQMFDRFRQTVLETLTKVDGPFWNRNRGQIQKINFMDSTVADWKMYDVNKYATKLDIRYSDDAPYLNSDEEMQAEIFKKFSVAPNDQRFSQDDTFSKKMIKCFYEGSIEKGKATPLANAKFNNDITFKFCDDIVRNGFNGTYMGNIKEDRRFINESFKNAQKNRQVTADKIADQKAQTMSNQKDNPVKAESANVDKFNLAEHFGLVVGEKIINLNEVEINISQTAQQNSQGDGSDGKAAGKLADARMNRYFKFMTYALSAKMTSAFAAYKQFMGLYRAAYKKPKNNTQTTNNQQQNTNQNNAENTNNNAENK